MLLIYIIFAGVQRFVSHQYSFDLSRTGGIIPWKIHNSCSLSLQSYASRPVNILHVFLVNQKLHNL